MLHQSTTFSLQQKWTLLHLCKNVILLSLAVPGLLALLQPSTICTTQKHDLRVPSKAQADCYCGSSVAEAEALGCQFDALASAWLPPHCRDDELTTEFIKSGPGPNGEWDYWLDEDHQIPTSLQEIMGTNRLRYYLTDHEHIAHCLFYWRKQYRARFTGVITEQRYDSEDHIKHCGAMFLRGPGHRNTTDIIKFGGSSPE